MSRILVLYHSFYGHVEHMAIAQADGASSVAGSTVLVKRVPELMEAQRVVELGGEAT